MYWAPCIYIYNGIYNFKSYSVPQILVVYHLLVFWREGEGLWAVY